MQQRSLQQVCASYCGDNMSKVQKRYLLIGGVVGLIVIALIVGALRPSSNALGPQLGTIDVEVVQVQKEDVPIHAEWIGTLDGLVNADVRAQVTGYLLKQGYQEGAFVKQGQLLFQIDPRPFQAALDQAEGQLAQAKAALANAEAVQRRTELDVQRYKPLAEQQAAEYEDRVLRLLAWPRTRDEDVHESPGASLPVRAGRDVGDADQRSK